MYSTIVCVQHHDPRLLFLSALICLVACLAAFTAYARAVASNGPYRLAWTLAIGALLGSGIWATHFVAILAYQSATVVGFEFTGTALSWVCAVTGIAGGVLVAGPRPNLPRRLLCGAAWGLSIAVMHFMGVFAMRLPAIVEWRSGLALTAILIGVAFAMAALGVIGDGRCRRRTTLAALLLVLAICGLHFTAMGAIVLQPGPMLWGPTVYGRDALGMALGVLVVMILLNGGAMLALDRFSKAAAFESLNHGLDQAPTALGFFDATHRLVIWNRAYADFMAAYGLRAQVGMTWLDIVRDRIVGDEVGGVMPTTLSKRRVGHEDIHFGELAMPDGRWLDARLAPTGEGGFVAVLNDVTAHRELVARETEARLLAEDASRMKSEFLANVSHEIRTPLNAVLGMVQVMGRERLSKPQRERLTVIDGAGRALLATLNDVLDLTKIEAGKLELEPHGFDLEELVSLTAAAYAPLAAQKDLAFDVRLDPQALGAWTGDSTRIRQVLTNLISNAVKFTASGRVTVSVSAEPEGLSFAVEDTGIGIAAGKLSAIFDKFTQADASMTRRFGGTGLGLAICHQLVELMGGRLDVKSEEGRGACFAFTVPLVRVEARDAAAVASTGEDADRPIRILAAEDNPTNQLILTALLEPLGVDLTMVGDGQQAAEAAATQAFDLILMDAQMPVLNGVEAATEIRRREREIGAPRTPIIALTANVMQHQLAEYAEAGMDGYVAKPIEAPKLFAAVAAAVEARAESEAAAA